MEIPSQPILNYKKMGHGKPVLILHGLFGLLDNWKTFGKALSHSHTVYLVDQRNHGRSFHSDIMDYPAMAQDIRQLLNELAIDQVTIIGHSMGGKAAMQFAFDFPERVSKLCVVDIAPKAYFPGHLPIFNALLDMDLAEISSRKEARSILFESIRSEAIVQFLLKNLSVKSDGLHWKMNLPALYEHYDNMISEVTSDDVSSVSTLFVSGGLSDYILASDKALIKEQFSQVQFATIPRAGHWVHADQYDSLLKVIGDFIG